MFFGSYECCVTLLMNLDACRAAKQQAIHVKFSSRSIPSHPLSLSLKTTGPFANLPTDSLSFIHECYGLDSHAPAFVPVYCGRGDCDSVNLSEPRMGDVLLGSWPEPMAAPAFSSSLITPIHLASRKRPNVAQKMLLTMGHRLTLFLCL